VMKQETANSTISVVPQFLLLGSFIGLAFMLNACAVREQSFGCEGVTDGTSSDEFLMTPTNLRFQSQDYRFSEERQASRIYIHQDTGQRLEFNTATGILQRESSQWRCKRIEL